jgi:hypothetical protein
MRTVRYIADATSVEAFRKSSEREDERRAFWAANRERLSALYPDEFVAVHEGEVVVHSRTLSYVLGFIDGRGIDPDEAYLEFLATTERFIL